MSEATCQTCGLPVEECRRRTDENERWNRVRWEDLPRAPVWDDSDRARLRRILRASFPVGMPRWALRLRAWMRRGER